MNEKFKNRKVKFPVYKPAPNVLGSGRAHCSLSKPKIKKLAAARSSRLHDLWGVGVGPFFERPKRNLEGDDITKYCSIKRLNFNLT